MKIFLLIFLVFNIKEACAAAAHQLHKQQEREEDGSYSPRDRKHYNEDQKYGFDHESIVGNVKEANEYDELSPEIAKQRLEILITKMDTNHDKIIDETELKSWILRSFRMLSKEESEDRMEEIDRNDDDYVEWSEVLKEEFDIDDAEDMNHLDDEDRKEEKKDHELFNAADANGDGKLDENEFLAFSHPEEVENMTPLLIKHTLDEKDKNEDGVLSFDEYIGSRATEHDEDWLKTEKIKFHDDYDKNSDGVLDKDEIGNWLVPSNDEIAADEVEHLFEKCDDDRDNLLTFDEILSHYDVFVGSEATDFGDHLQDLDRFDDEL